MWLGHIFYNVVFIFNQLLFYDTLYPVLENTVQGVKC